MVLNPQSLKITSVARYFLCKGDSEVLSVKCIPEAEKRGGGGQTLVKNVFCEYVCLFVLNCYVPFQI